MESGCNRAVDCWTGGQTEQGLVLKGTMFELTLDIGRFGRKTKEMGREEEEEEPKKRGERADGKRERRGQGGKHVYENVALGINGNTTHCSCSVFPHVV